MTVLYEVKSPRCNSKSPLLYSKSPLCDGRSHISFSFPHHPPRSQGSEDKHKAQASGLRPQASATTPCWMHPCRMQLPPARFACLPACGSLPALCLPLPACLPCLATYHPPHLLAGSRSCLPAALPTCRADHQCRPPVHLQVCNAQATRNSPQPCLPSLSSAFCLHL